MTHITWSDALKSVIFWGVFYETSEDKYFSGHPRDVKNHFYGNADPRSLLATLVTAPYCLNTGSSLGSNDADDEKITYQDPNDWNPNIWLVSHCNPLDHRGFYVQGIINNLLIRERLSGTDQIMLYFLGNSWSSSFGDPTAEIWNERDACVGNYTLPYPTYLAAKKEGYESLINWLHAYLQCQVFNTSDDPNHVNRRLYFQSAYQNIMREIDNAIANIAFDHSLGVTTMIQANVSGDSSPFIHTIANCNTANTNLTNAMQVYSQLHIPTLRGIGTNGYEPGLRTVLRPVVFADLYNRPNDGQTNYEFTCYQWVTFAFQNTNNSFRR